MIKLKITNNSVDFFKDGKSTPIYQIPKVNLAETLNNGNSSLWINQLLSKSWIEEQALYEFSEIIQKEFPNNNIDWKSTYSIINGKFNS